MAGTSTVSPVSGRGHRAPWEGEGKQELRFEEMIYFTCRRPRAPPPAHGDPHPKSTALCGAGGDTGGDTSGDSLVRRGLRAFFQHSHSAG
eukprot:543888-Prymnesium_polylepis.1